MLYGTREAPFYINEIQVALIIILIYVTDDDDDLCFTAKGNETKSKTKQPSDMPTPGFEHGW